MPTEVTEHCGTVRVIDNLSLAVDAGEPVAPPGLSGCDKPALLRMNFAADTITDAPPLCSRVLHDRASGRLTILAFDCSPDEVMERSVELRGMGALALQPAEELHDADLKAANSRHAPDRVAPASHAEASLLDGRLPATLRSSSRDVFTGARE